MIYAYTRVSTEQQVSDGQSLDMQQRMLEGYCMQHAFKIDRVFEERAVSGSIPLHDRPAGKELLDLLQPGDVVLTTKLDRVFRSALDALGNLKALTEKNVSLHMLDMGGDVTRGGMSKLMFTIAAAFAEAERDRIRERIRDTKRSQKKLGKFLGGSRPFGFDIDGRELVKNPREFAALEAMRGLNGIKSTRAIAKHVLDVYGIKLSHVTVAKILQTQ